MRLFMDNRIKELLDFTRDKWELKPVYIYDFEKKNIYYAEKSIVISE
jgi:hypothetical protein